MQKEVILLQIGVSSSCFYPLKTESAFKIAGELGVKTAEIFFNSQCELHSPVLNEIIGIQNYYGINVRSIHPYTSFAEPYMLFGKYERRIEEAIDFYKNYFEAAEALGAECVVLHGGYLAHPQDEPLYAEVLNRLCTVAEPYSVSTAHEIVVGRTGSSLEFMSALKRDCGKNFKAVLDIKQCRRSAVDEYKFIDLFADDIMQIHISDFNGSADCLPPGEGEYDFLKLFSYLKKSGYDKSAVIELYADGYKDIKQIADSKIYLENIDRMC